jgi:hypothetical protein
VHSRRIIAVYRDEWLLEDHSSYYQQNSQRPQQHADSHAGVGFKAGTRAEKPQMKSVPQPWGSRQYSAIAILVALTAGAIGVVRKRKQAEQLRADMREAKLRVAYQHQVDEEAEQQFKDARVDLAGLMQRMQEKSGKHLFCWSGRVLMFTATPDGTIVLTAIRECKALLARCTSPQMTAISKDTEFKSSLLASNGLSVLEQLKQSGDEMIQQEACALLEQVLPLIWSSEPTDD